MLCSVLLVFVLCLVYPMLPMSLGCPFFITNVSGLSILHYQCLWVVHSSLPMSLGCPFFITNSFIYQNAVHYNCCIRLYFIYNLWVTMCIVNDFLNDNFVLIVISVYGIPLSKAIMFYCKVKLEWHFHSILTDWNSLLLHLPMENQSPLCLK